jgi:uncharacterized protein YbgA (DUF1722 family)
MAHSRGHFRELGRLVASPGAHRPRELVARYGELFMAALVVRATPRKHVNVLQHIVGHFRNRLEARDRAELARRIDEYHRGIVPLVVPLTLIRHHLSRVSAPWVEDQVYLNPHPQELMLRNHA